MNEKDKLVEQIKNETDIFNKAKLIEFIIKQKKERIVDLAKKLSMKPSYICHILRLNRLPDLVIDGYYARNISLSHLFVVSRLKNKDEIIKLYEKLLSKPMTVLQTEEIVRENLYGTKTKGEYIQKDEIKRFEDFIKRDNIKVKIIQTRIKSKCIIEIKGNLEKTSELLRKLMKIIESWNINE